MAVKERTVSDTPLAYPAKSGTYTVQYKDEQGQYRREVVTFDKKNGKWTGTQTVKFYEDNVISWFIGDITVPSEAMHRAYKLLGKE